jgi:hypothetical protein
MLKIHFYTGEMYEDDSNPMYTPTRNHSQFPNSHLYVNSIHHQFPNPNVVKRDFYCTGLSGGVDPKKSLTLSLFSYSSMACVPARCISNRSRTSARRCCALDNLRDVWSSLTSIVATSICKCNNRFNVPESKFEIDPVAQVRSSSSILS